MPKFDVNAARAEGYTDEEIAAYLAEQTKFDLKSAIDEGYTADEIIQHLSGPIVARPEPDDSLSQWGGVLSGALAPYATAAALGGAVGAPLAGVGALPGAAGGVLTLGLGDIGTSLYNAAAPLFGGQRVALPSETIREQFVNAGLATNPQTPGQRVASDVVSGLAGGIAQPAAMGVQATRMAPSVTRDILNVLSKQRAAQAGGAAGAAAAPSVAQNYFDVNDPLALTGLSLAGGMAGGRATARRPATVTREQLAKQSENAYKSAEEAGVNLSPEAMTGLKARVDDLLSNMDYDPEFHPLVKRAAKIFESKAGAPMTFKKLEEFRRTVRDLPYSEGGGAAGTKTERAMVGRMADAINDYMMTLDPAQTTGGDTATAATRLSQARGAARRNFEADLIEETTKRAAGRASGSKASNLSKEFGKIADKPRRMARLTKETQAGVNALAEGKGFGTLASVGKFAPDINLKNLGGLMAGGAGAAYMGRPELGVAGAVLGGGALAAKGIANRIASGQANKLASAVRGTPKFAPNAPIAAQTVQQMAQQIDPKTGFPAFDADGNPLATVIALSDGVPIPVYLPRSKPANTNAMRR